MPVNSPNILYVGDAAYDLSKVSAWVPDSNDATITRVRFDGVQSETLIKLPTTAFESAYQSGTLVELASGVTAQGVQAAQQVSGAQRTYQATVTGTGAVSATVLIEVSNDGTNWFTQATISLSGTDSDTDGVALEANWPYVRGNVTAIAGTGATLELTLNLGK